MAWCGYDPEMSEGLQSFGRGIAASTLRKVAKSGRSINEQIKHEGDELAVLREELEKAAGSVRSEDEAARIRPLIAMTFLCQAAFFDLAAADEEEFRAVFGARFEFYGELVRHLEDGYEGSVESDVAARMRDGIKAVLSAT